MIMDYLFILETALYYCTLLLFAGYILDRRPRKPLLVLSFLLFVPMLISTQAGNDLYIVSNFLFILLQFPILRAIFPGTKLKYLIFFFLFMNCVNVMLISIVINSLGINAIGSTGILVDFAFNLLTAAVWCVICLTGLRHKLRQILLYTPRHVLFVSCLLFVAMIIVDVSAFGHEATKHPGAWQRFQTVGVGLLKLAVCVAFPVFIMVSASNSRLTHLAASYEQQLRAQAEHYQALAQANWEIRRFRHDFKNTRFAMETLLSDGDTAQALALLREWGDILNAPNRSMTLFDTGNGIADALLTDKQQRASQHHTVIRFQGAIPSNTLAPTDLCVLLGNTVDNALEACRKLPAGAERTVSVTCNCNSGFLFLSVQNPTAQPVTVRNNRIETTKEDKNLHGFGLLSLESVVNKYQGTLRLLPEENSFSANITVCLQK